MMERIMETDGMEPFQGFFYIGMDRRLANIYRPAPGGVALNIGAGSKIIPGARSLDLPEWNADLSPIPWNDESISTIHAYHFLEHVKDPVAVLRECQRVLKVGGVMNVVVPYYSAAIAADDLDHKSRFNENTWKTLFDNDYYDKDKIGWRFNVHFNLIAGIVERNLCLFTQLVKV
jgi:SAM-dependent methyltransferase